MCVCGGRGREREGEGERDENVRRRRKDEEGEVVCCGLWLDYLYRDFFLQPPWLNFIKIILHFV